MFWVMVVVPSVVPGAMVVVRNRLFSRRPEMSVPFSVTFTLSRALLQLGDRDGIAGGVGYLDAHAGIIR